TKRLTIPPMTVVPAARRPAAPGAAECPSNGHCPRRSSRIVAVPTRPGRRGRRRAPPADCLATTSPHPESARREVALGPATAAPPAALEEALVRRIGPPRYQLWFAPHTRFHLADDELVVGVPNLHFQEWLAKKFRADVQAAARDVTGRAIPVRFAI